MLIDGSDYGKKSMLDALNLPSSSVEPGWPLPNMKATTEAEFWSWQCSYSPVSRAHVLGRKIDGKWTDIFIFRMPDVGMMIDGGFVITVARNDYPQPPDVTYSEWRACEHQFDCKTVRMCHRKYTCRKCGKSYDEHSD